MINTPIENKPNNKVENSNVPQQRQAADPGVAAKPITELERTPRTVKTGGRPKTLPPMPDFSDVMSVAENTLFNDYITEQLELYPDLTKADYRKVFMAGVEYIKSLRVERQELESKKVISMARQHPMTFMQRLEESLSITRRQRQRAKPTSDGEETDELKQLYTQMQYPQ